MSSISYTPIATKSSNFIRRCLYVIKITLKVVYMSSIGYTPIVTKSSNFIHRCLYFIKITLKSCLHVIYWLYTVVTLHNLG